MGTHLEPDFPSWLAAGLRPDDATRPRDRKRCRRRFDAVLLPLEDRRLLSTFPVTSIADDGSTGTLRWAVAGANADMSPSTIVFELGTAPATITLTQGQLELSNTSESVTIDDGPGQGPVTISGNDQAGAFQVDPGATASISGLTITGGATLESGGHGGGSINDLGTLTLSDCTITNNPLASTSASGVYINGTAQLTDCTITGGNSYYGAGVDIVGGKADLTGCTIEDNNGEGNVVGAGVFNAGTTTLANCTISGNWSGGSGGGLYNAASGQLDVSGGTISGNTSVNGGAGVYNRGTAHVSGCTIGGNRAGGNGGGVWNRNGETIDLSGCTISGNTASIGGGLCNDGTATLTGCTVGKNTAYKAGGVANGPLHDTAVLTLTGSTISDNTANMGGGGVFNYGQATLTDSTIAGNLVDQGIYTTTTDGGGIDDSGKATLVACTISGNSATARGGGIYVGGTGTSTLTLEDTIVADNDSASTGGSASPNDIIAGTAGAVVSGSHNLVGIGGSAGLANGTDGNIVLTSLADLGLAPLGNNGGPTETMALSYRSEAMQAGTSIAGITTDQRGHPLDAPPDIGAYQASPLLRLSFTGLTSPSITYGTASVTISGILAKAPDTESVQVTLDGVTQSIAIGTGGAFSTRFDTSTLGASGSPYTISYSYTGDGTYASASATSALTVNRATPTVNVADSGGTYNGLAFDATASVARAAGPAGANLEAVPPTVFYYAGTTATGTPMTGAPTAAGIYTAIADFPGTADYAAARSQPVTFAIGRDTPTVALSTSAASAVYGQSVSFSVTVTTPGGAPTGTVTFFDDGTTLGTVALNASGMATLTTSAMAVAPHSITAIYSGDADAQGTTSAPVAETVAKAGIQIVLVPRPHLKKGKVVSVELAAEVIPATPGGGMPTGVLAFWLKQKANVKTLGTVALSGGRATLTLKANGVMHGPITIAYAGNENFASSTTTPTVLTQRVIKSLARPMVAPHHRGRRHA